MDKIRVGLFGGSRASAFFYSLKACGAEIVAVCDKAEMFKNRAKERLGEDITFYEDFEEFINHPMDAVVIANYFHEHAPYAIRFLEKNIHVLSECTAAGTMAECVALVRAAEKSDAIYMLCENYPYMIFNQEMRKIVKEGTLGDILYAEGEYNHPGNPAGSKYTNELFDGTKHWRHFLPRTYYVTHSMAPLMLATGAFPKRVTAMPVAPFADLSHIEGRASHVPEPAAIITTLNDDYSVFKVTGNSSFGSEGNSYRFCGRRGQIENVRGANDMISLNYNPWQIPEGKQQNSFYKAHCYDKDIEHVQKAGHGGGDFFVIREFLDCIRNNRKPVMDVYFATTLSAVGILGHRSLLEAGVPYDIPDFKNEEDRKKYENDTLSPFYYTDGREPTMPCSYNRDYKPTESQKEVWLKRVERKYNS